MATLLYVFFLYFSKRLNWLLRLGPNQTKRINRHSKNIYMLFYKFVYKFKILIKLNFLSRNI
ncbi:MAG: hypothetical protein JWQ14_319 [Adhaeribacter sp.]|nr:hypothetical protein [Adhaeribacter sp.]